MHNVFKGIVVGFIGFVLWFIFSFMEALAGWTGDRTALGTMGMYLGFAIMIIGPVVYIVIIPVVNLVRRRRAR